MFHPGPYEGGHLLLGGPAKLGRGHNFGPWSNWEGGHEFAIWSNRERVMKSFLISHQIPPVLLLII